MCECYSLSCMASLRVVRLVTSVSTSVRRSVTTDSAYKGRGNNNANGRGYSRAGAKG